MPEQCRMLLCIYKVPKDESYRFFKANLVSQYIHLGDRFQTQRKCLRTLLEFIAKYIRFLMPKPFIL